MGGLGGFGRVVAKWMATKGAGYIAFVSRSGRSSAAQQWVCPSLLSFIIPPFSSFPPLFFTHMLS